MAGTWTCPSLLTIDRVLNEKEEDQEKNIERHLQVPMEQPQNSMPYKETCSLCKGNGYITIVVEGKDEIKQCWLCESKGEKEYSQAEIDDFIYKTYFKKPLTSIPE